MKVAIINSVYKEGSTGNLCFALSEYFQNNGVVSKVFYGRNKKKSDGNSLFFGGKLSLLWHIINTRLFDNHGLCSKHATKKLIRMLENFNPDIYLLNNLHGYYVNYPLLCKFLSLTNKPVFWVFHDCWNFTGHCAYFELKQCEKWKIECNKCLAKRMYPRSIAKDNSLKNFMVKKSIFSNLKNLHIITPSYWLSNKIKESFFANFDVTVINNGVDQSVFKRIDSNFKSRIGCNNKKIILCVANVFDERKGLNDIVSLSNIVDKNTVIVIVGKIKKRIPKLKNVIFINQTTNLNDLVQIYSSADVFFNPTYEDTFSNTNMEAISCRLPVVCYKTGGAQEMVDERFLINKGDIIGAWTKIKRIFDSELIYDFSSMKNLNCSLMHKKYFDLIIRDKK